ncbi:MAG TPA: toast rack family protein [Bryobacteraceae bacterium]|nr:toast rack family protein [Bryobacteraceae bacterium]
MPAFTKSLMPIGAGCLFVTCFVTACGPDFGPPGPERTESRSIPLDQSEETRVDLNMGAGELRVRGGATNFLEGRFTYNRLRLRPEISYSAGGFRSHLKIQEPNHAGASGRKYAWDLQFNNAKPLDLEVNFGAGEAHLDLEDLALRRVEIHMGIGQLKMDLRGTPKNDYSVFIRGGVGEATVYLPQNVGIEADVQGGIGDIHVSGLEKRDGRYVNESYGHAKNNIHLDVRGGIGAIHLIAN